MCTAFLKKINKRHVFLNLMKASMPYIENRQPQKYNRKKASPVCLDPKTGNCRPNKLRKSEY